MGLVKGAWMEHQGNVASAAHYLVSKGILDSCEIHGEIFDAGVGLDGFWPIAVNEKKKGDHGAVPWAADLTHREFTDVIQQAFDDHCGDECGWCAKNAAD